MSEVTTQELQQKMLEILLYFDQFCKDNGLTYFLCGGCLIGAGAVVIRDIKEPGTYVGVPARLIKKRGEASGPERDERTGLD